MLLEPLRSTRCQIKSKTMQSAYHGIEVKYCVELQFSRARNITAPSNKRDFAYRCATRTADHLHGDPAAKRGKAAGESAGIRAARPAAIARNIDADGLG